MPKTYPHAGQPEYRAKGKGRGHAMTTAEFIEIAEKVHGQGRYDYSQTHFRSTKFPVTVICREHGPFTKVNARNFIYHEQGCPTCGWRDAGLERREVKTLDDTIELLEKHYGEGRYTYSKLADERVAIRCPRHGVFRKVALGDKGSVGCKACRDEIREEVKAELQGEPRKRVVIQPMDSIVALIFALGAAGVPPTDVAAYLSEKMIPTDHLEPVSKFLAQLAVDLPVTPRKKKAT